MSIWSDRTFLASKSWTTDLRIEIDRSGRIALGLWAKTWFWQSRVTEVSLRAHALPSSALEIPAALDAVSARVREAVERAERTFTDRVPCMTGHVRNGLIELVDNKEESRRAFAAPAGAVPPEAIRFLVDGHEHGQYRDGIAAIMAEGDIDWHDTLNNYAEARYLRDPTPREWQFACQPYMRQIGGTRIRTDHIRQSAFSTRLIDESVSASLTQMAAGALRSLFAAYGPGGPLHRATGNGLPPGYETVAAYLDRQKQAQTGPCPSPAEI